MAAMNTETLKAELTKIYSAGGSYVLAKTNAAQKRARKVGLSQQEAHDATIEVRIALNVGPRGERDHAPNYG
jgi:hypothetical protein